MTRILDALTFLAGFLLLAAFCAVHAIGPAMAGPVPKYRAKPSPAPCPGSWLLTWGGVSSDMTLLVDGTHTYGKPWEDFRGSWSWDGSNRTLWISETKDGINWSSWGVRLDEQMCGVAEYGVHRTTVKLKKGR